MADLGNNAAAVKDQVAETAQQAAGKAQEAAASPAVDALARLGYAARGVLYGTVGVLALGVATQRGGATTDKDGAIAAIGAQPFGKFLLLVMVIGLAGYALWGFIRAALDPLGRGSDPKGIAQRIGYGISGLTYAALVIPTLQVILGSGGGGGAGPQDLSAKLLGAPFGPLLLGLIGLIAIIGGIGQFVEAYSAKFVKDFKTAEMTARTKTVATRIGQFGLAARGVVFALMGFFLIQAARTTDPAQAKGLDGALQTLAQQPFGPWLLGIVALGLLAFGIYSLLCARWVRIVRA